jgi:hypothetical protein
MSPTRWIETTAEIGIVTKNGAGVLENTEGRKYLK